eukprot:9543823-Prorocentrum_lima.AAC.1
MLRRTLAQLDAVILPRERGEDIAASAPTCLEVFDMLNAEIRKLATEVERLRDRSTKSEIALASVVEDTDSLLPSRKGSTVKL